jgi:predicted transcriptional regulator
MDNRSEILYRRPIEKESHLVEDQIKGLTAQIVSAHIANNNVAAQQIPALIRDVHQALISAGQAPAEVVKPEPSVSVKKSIFADHILCLDCGGSFKMLKRHIGADHGMTPDAYRAKWELPASYPMVAPDYAATRSELAKASGLGRKAEPTPSLKKRGRPKKG